MNRPGRDQPASDHVDAMLALIAGRRIYGGCEDCDAYQEVRQLTPGVWNIRVFHDDWCPTLARHERRRPAG